MSKKIYGITVGTPTPRSNFNQTDPKKADYIIGRENIATKDDLANAGGGETLFFTENQLPLDTSTDVTELVTYKPSFSEASGAFGEKAGADTIPNMRVVCKQGVASYTTEEVLPLVHCYGAWADGFFTLYFGNKDYLLSLVYQYDTSVTPYGDLLSITALLTTETAGGVTEEYVDEAIQNAILDSWEAEV